jgi:Flp pilus assembly secretin CpaC
MKKKSLFAIYLVEDENGFVTVKSHQVGQGLMCYEIGLEILSNLKIAEAIHPEILSVDYMHYSDQLQ